jgi:ubiquinone biosynthesis protein
VSLEEFVSYYGSQSLDRLDLGGALTEMAQIVRRHDLVMPSRVSLLLKVLVMLEGTGRLLSPRFSLMDLIAGVRKQVLRRRLSPRHQWRRFQRLYGEWIYLAETLPRALGEVVDQVRAGRFDVHLDHRRLQPSVNRLVFGIVTSALFLGSVELWSRRVPPLVADTSVLGVLGCAVSMCLGFVLQRAIHKSGDLE